MKQEDKELLLKDLCARLPYGVKAHYKYYDFIGGEEQLTDEDNGIITGIDTNMGNPIKVNGYYVEVEYVEPYLRLLSSMSEEEENDFYFLSESIIEFGDSHKGILSLKQIDYLNSHHFDYRSLIEKGLALEAPEGMYQ